MRLVIDRTHAQFINDVTDVHLSQELELANVVQAQFSGGLNLRPSAASRWIGFFDDLKELVQAIEQDQFFAELLCCEYRQASCLV